MVAKSIRTLQVNSAAEAEKYLREAFAGAFDGNESVLIKFGDWIKFDLNVKGERYDSTMPTQLMKALLEYQSIINALYSSAVYGKGARSLTDEARQNNELVFHVEHGSSEMWAKLGEMFNEISSRLVEKMTGRQLVVTVLGLALIASLHFGFRDLLDNQKETLAEKDRHALEMKLLEESAAARKAYEDLGVNALNVIKSVSDANSLRLGPQKFSKAKIQSIANKARESYEPKRLDGEYRIVGLKSLKDRWTIQLLDEQKDVTIRTELYRTEFASSAIGEISEAFAKEKPIMLYVIARVRGDEISQAKILGTRTTGFGVAH